MEREVCLALRARGSLNVNECLGSEEERAALAGFWWGLWPYCLIDTEAPKVERLFSLGVSHIQK
jgi:hypothetical protein